MKVNNITELIGRTPLVKINKINEGNAEIYAKLEYFNPSGSVKDRAAFYMLKCAIDEGKVNEDTVIIEPTSGNTGIGLAMCAAQAGLKIILTMPESMSEERKKILKGFGAKLVLTPAKAGMQGAVDKALELLVENPNSFMPSQFTNPNNPKIHYITTAEEILADTDGEVAAFVAGIGSGGTITGVSKKLKEHNPNIYTVGVEPKESPLLTEGKAGSHGIQGIGANFVPDVLSTEFVDEIIDVPTEEAIKTAKACGHQEGILCGISSGAAHYAANELSKRPEFAGKVIVALLPDFGERYLSTKLFEE
ncbi:MAG: cysteine synthase A [Candidatus Gastranaerophilaceae bacterium]